MMSHPASVADLQSSMSDAVERARALLVQVGSGRRGAGSGTIWRADGLVVTNAHVVGRSAVRVVLPDGTERRGEVQAVDPRRDLAAVRIDTAGLPSPEIGDSRELRPGHWVFALGYPWGVPGAVTAGVVIGIGASLPELSNGGHDLLALSLHLRPGHSGGPLLDAQGRLMGVNTMMNGPDVGVAIPAHVVEAFLREQGIRK
jgi:S1-C subfamily serine protease